MKSGKQRDDGREEFACAMGYSRNQGKMSRMFYETLFDGYQPFKIAPRVQ